MLVRCITGILIAVAVGSYIKAEAEEPSPAQGLPIGFIPHVRSVGGGQVDWANGDIIAEGRANARGTTRQDRLMAQRGARVVAARNALAIAMGLQVDANGRFADIRDGEVQLRGVLKGHTTISADWRPNQSPPECLVRLRVPLWGAKGVASVVYTAQRGTAISGGRRRLALSRAVDDVSAEVLVIDARGTGVVPCLFPVVAEPGGAVLYDVGTAAHRRQPLSPIVQYAEATLTGEELRTQAAEHWTGATAAAAGGHTAAWRAVCDMGVLRGGARETIWLAHAGEPVAVSQPSRATTQPATQPATQPSRKSRRRPRVVKAARAAGKNKTEIVLTREDADKLRQSKEGAALLRRGQVVIVVDSIAAGIQGRHDGGPNDTILALSTGR